MSADAAPPDDHTRGEFAELPAHYVQVMSPSGDAVPGLDERRRGRPMINGTDRTVSGATASEEAYASALAAAGPGATRTDDEQPSGGSGATERAVDPVLSQRDPLVQAAEPASTGTGEVFQSPVTSGMHRDDPPLLPHAAIRPGANTAIFDTPAYALPSAFPSPVTHSARTAAEQSASGIGMNFAQHSANAVRWFTRLGDFVQRRVAQQSRPGLETTVVQETVWTPGGSTRRAAAPRAETQPLFDQVQAQRLREMTVAAPQLYGSTSQAAGGSDSSRSFTREQVEQEVRRQVQQAMRGQTQLSEENQRLRDELEALQRQVAVTRAPRASNPAAGEVEPEGNPPPGLSGYNREREGQQLPRVLPLRAQEDFVGPCGQDDGRGSMNASGLHGGQRGVPTGQDVRDGERGKQRARSLSEPRGYLSELLGRFGGSEGQGNAATHPVRGGNPLGLPSRGEEVVEDTRDLRRGDGGLQEEASGLRAGGGYFSREVEPGGNPPGLSGYNREREGRFSNYVQHVPAEGSGPVVYDGHGQESYPFAARESRQQSPGENDAGGGAGVGNGSGEKQLEALLKGMTQLQAAMTMQLGLQAARPETIRPGTSGSELPKLVEADEYAAINVGDWLHGLSGPMGDLTDGSSGWWAETMRCLDNFYQTFVTSSAVKKLNLKAEDYMSEFLREPKWHRVDKRAASMLLQAVPEAIKGELLANRLGTTLGILGRIVTIYRPGSAAERQQVLKALESPGHGSSPVEVVEVLRKWARWLKRAQDLSLQVPDASILLRGLDAAVKGQLAQNYEINFRTNMLRFSLDLDTAPTLSTVSRFHSHLLGEFEQLAYRGRGKGTSGATPTVKNVAAMNQDGGGTPKGGASPQQPAGKPCNSSSRRRVASAPIASTPMTGWRYQRKREWSAARLVEEKAI